ncbi:MAG: cytochrome c [Crocinitomicaceae bacterium]|nr:cytochrome c [Crocinitomicaceae bacterium]
MKLQHKRFIFFSLVFAYISFSIFVYTKGTDTKSGMNMNAREGKKIFQEKNCIACHQIYGLGGYMGPDLTNVISLKGELYTRSFIENGTAKMPDFDLNTRQVNALIAYLSFIDSTTVYPDSTTRLTWYGNMERSK